MVRCHKQESTTNINEALLKAESVKINGREPKSCLSWVFNFELVSFASKQHKWMAWTQALLELKTRPRFCPVSWSLSANKAFSFSYFLVQDHLVNLPFCQCTKSSITVFTTLHFLHKLWIGPINYCYIMPD